MTAFKTDIPTKEHFFTILPFKSCIFIGVGRFCVLHTLWGGGGGGGGGGVARFRILGGTRGPNSQQAHDFVLTSMRRTDIASTSFRHHLPTRFLINQCQIITFLILKFENIENSRLELKGIVCQYLQIK